MQRDQKSKSNEDLATDKVVDEDIAEACTRGCP